MSNGPVDNGEHLYHLLPAIYRERDESGDLKGYLAALGALLDALENTLDQRMADNFPDLPLEGKTGQAWLLPYFADLLDVTLVSPTEAGRRHEVARAVAWRQGKGSMAVAREIAEAILAMPVSLQEGWQRVAVTPRVGMPLLPAREYGLTPAPDMRFPSQAARHPGLPAVTVDLSRAGRAVRAPAGCRPDHAWNSRNPHGVPCTPGGYDDVTRRTVDLRTPTWRAGHHHPRRLLIHTLPPPGFFPERPRPRRIRWQDHDQPDYADLIRVTDTDGRYAVVNISGDPIHITGPVDLTGRDRFHLQGFRFGSPINCVDGRLSLTDVAAPRVVAQAVGAEEPALVATSCLFRDVTAARGRLEMVFCTVLRETIGQWIDASDCIFMEQPRRDHDHPDPPEGGCVRYSRLPDETLGGVVLVRDTLTTSVPVFFDDRFGHYAGGVLHPATPRAIARGAEDGGEMGAYHDRHYQLRTQAVLDKLRDYLPMGLEAVLIPDMTLLCPPPELTE